MNLPYLARLAGLSLAAFFLVHAALAILVSLLTPWVTRVTNRLTPATGARVLLTLRLFPACFTLFLVAGVCTPSYLWLEPKAQEEPMGFLCLAAATLGLAVWAFSLTRAVRALRRSSQHVHQCRQAAREVRLPGERVAAWVIDGSAPCVMLAGIVQPRVVISRSVMAALSAEQLSAAIRHERAHGIFRDNLKRLLVLLVPDILPNVRLLRNLERAWARTAEWAADDLAAAGKPRRSLSLAAALVRVARLGAGRGTPALTTSLMADSTDLSERVDRLLHPMPPAKRVQHEPVLVASSTLLIAVAIVAVVAHPVTMHAAHEFLEFLIQ